MRIVVTGLAATFPYGGVFWDYLQYVLGFHQLGHDVLYLEDTGKWCYKPEAGTFVETGEENAKRLADSIDRFMPELADRWSFRDGSDNVFGMPADKAVDFCRTADLFIHLSASCTMRDQYFEADRVVFVDSDPMYTQAKFVRSLDTSTHDDANMQHFLSEIAHYDAFFSFGENVGKTDCLIPQAGREWRPTRQPIVIDHFAEHRLSVEQRRKTLTTVASWSPREVSVEIDGQTFGGKSMEFERFMGLPRKLALPMELAISGDFPRERLVDNAWNPVDALPVSDHPDAYRDYLANSAGEFSVAKHAYVASNSGWFSCRTACYLALGVPAVVQDTGFTGHIPSGSGVFAFTNEDEAIAGVQAIKTDPAGQARAAEEIAREYFDARTVLTRFIDLAMNDQPVVTINREVKEKKS